MSALDDLLAQRAAGNVAAFPTAVPPAPNQSPTGLDALLAARASGAQLPQAAGVDPDAPRSWSDEAKDFLAASGHHLANLPHGIAQLVENGIASQSQNYQNITKELPDWGKAFAQALPGIGMLTTDNPVSRYVISAAQSDNAALAQRESEYQKSVPDSAGAYAGAAFGEIAPLLMGAPAKALNSAGDFVASKVVPYLPKDLQKYGAALSSGATQGAITSVAQPVTNTSQNLTELVTGEKAPDYFASKAVNVALGTLLGGSVPAASGITRSTLQGIKNTAAPIMNPGSVVAPSLEGLLTKDGQIPVQDVISALQAPSSLVEGSFPTTAQKLAGAVDGGHPQAVMAEKTVSNTPEGKILFTNRDISNNAARLNVLRGLAGSDDDLAAAIQNRRDAVAPAIDRILADPSQNPSVLQTSQPILASSITRKIDALASTSFGTDPVIGKTLKAIRQQVLDAADKTDVNAYTYTPPQLASLRDEPYVRPDLLDGIRQNLRNTISENSSNGAVSSKQEAGLQPLSDHITSAIESANPGYRDYLETYAKSSQPINSMEAARSILERVAGDGVGANAAGDAQTTLTRYRSALSKALSGPYGLEPNARSTLEAIQSDLQRSSISGSIKSAGSDTAFNLQAPGWLAGKVFGGDMSGSAAGAKALAGALGGLAGIMHGPMAAAGGAGAAAAAINKISNLGQQRTAAMLAKALAEPEYAADLLSQAQKAKLAPPSSAAALRIPQVNLLTGQILGQPNQ